MSDRPFATVKDADAMIAGLQPELQAGEFVFCTTRDAALAALALPDALAFFRETEGLSLVLGVTKAAALGFDVAQPMRCITLRVYSALEGVGLTAAVAGALAERGIACNMIAAHHHDHALVPAAHAEAALDVLLALQGSAAR